MNEWWKIVSVLMLFSYASFDFRKLKGFSPALLYSEVPLAEQVGRDFSVTHYFELH